MTQWIRWWGLGLFAAIILTWWLCIDFIVKSAIETFGTEIVGAKVELNSATLTLFPASLGLSGLQVTDPSAPMSNMVEVKTLSASLDTLTLFGRKILAEEMTIGGLQFNTTRTSSGAITDKVPSSDDTKSASFDLGGAIPGLSLPNVNDLIDKEKDQIKKQYDDINRQLKSIEAQWKERLDKLPDSKKIDQYKKRWDKLEDANFLEKISGLKKLKNDINDDIDQLDGLDDQLSKDSKTVNTLLARAKEMPSTQSKRILSKVGLGDSSEGGFVSALVGDQLKPLLQRGLDMLKNGTSTAEVEPSQTPAYVRGEGTWVNFTQERSLPDVLIKKASLDGSVELAGETINFTGTAQNLTHQPRQWNKPAKFSIKGESTSKAKINFNGVLDHRKKSGQDKINVRVLQLPLNNIVLSDKPELQVTLERAVTTIKSKLLLANDTMDFNVIGKFSKVKLEIDNRKPSTSSTVIANTLTSVKNFGMELAVNGPVSDPDVKVKSSLDNLLGKALGEQLKQQSEVLRTKLTKSLKEQMAPQLNKLNKNGNFLGDIEKLLAGKKSELGSLTKGL